MYKSIFNSKIFYHIIRYHRSTVVYNDTFMEISTSRLGKLKGKSIQTNNQDTTGYHLGTGLEILS